MEYSTLTDEQLTIKIKQKDHFALSELIKRYQNKLFHYVVRLIGREDDAEDVVQETFLKVYENIQSFDDERKFSSWVYRIAHNLAINQVKKNKRLTSVEAHTLDWLDEHHQEVDDFISQDERQQLSQEMISLMAYLRPEYKNALLLYYFEEKSYEEISDILHIPQATVGVWLKRARVSLKQLVDKQTKINATKPVARKLKNS